MLVVRVELWDANTGERSELARAVIANDGTGDTHYGNYNVKVSRRAQAYESWDRFVADHSARVMRHPRAANVWYLVQRALVAALTQSDP